MPIPEDNRGMNIRIKGGGDFMQLCVLCDL